MGKKSKRKCNKSPCYHGCITKKEFNCGEYFKILEDFRDSVHLLQVDLEGNEPMVKFVRRNHSYLVNPSFGRFVAAHVADDYLKGKDVTDLLFLLVYIRYKEIPHDEGKDRSIYIGNYNKYTRDIRTERGIINVIVREIPCNCMDEKRIEAKSMGKNAMCFSCHEEFPKKNMLRCKGCDYAQYCSQKCSFKDWVDHKELCIKYRENLCNKYSNKYWTNDNK